MFTKFHWLEMYKGMYGLQGREKQQKRFNNDSEIVILVLYENHFSLQKQKFEQLDNVKRLDLFK